MLSHAALYQILHEFVDEGVVAVNAWGKIVWVNKSLEQMFGYSHDELLNEELEKLIPITQKENHKIKRATFTRDASNRPSHNKLEFEGQTKSGKSLWLHISLSAYEENEELYSIAIITDITEKRAAELDLKKYADRANLFLKMSKTIFLELDSKGTIKLINNEGCQVLGTTQEAVIGKNWFNTFVEKKDRPRVRKVFRNLIKGDSKIAKLVNSKVLTTSGNKKLIQWYNTPVKDDSGNIVGTLSSGLDITEQEGLRKAQTEIILIATEKERKRIAMELHDGIIQILSAVSMNLKSLDEWAKHIPETNRKAFFDAITLVEETISEIRAISHDLMPSVIIRYGLLKALEDLAIRTMESSGIVVHIDPDHIHEGLDQMQAVNIYRIIQELIQNTLKHAEATSINIKIDQKNSKIFLRYKDDGHGFDVPFELSRSAGVGMQNIKARVDSMEGELSITSSSKKGTAIDITVNIN